MFESLKGYVAAADHAALKRDILDFLTAEKIVITDEAMTWTDAVYFAGETLIRDGSILEKYLDAIISQTTYYGTYMFLNSDIMNDI